MANFKGKGMNWITVNDILYTSVQYENHFNYREIFNNKNIFKIYNESLTKFLEIKEKYETIHDINQEESGKDK